MLLIILALFWVALLAPVVVRRFRDSGTEKSIQSFHAEHEVLSRQDYSVAPAHRLDQPDRSSGPLDPAQHRPRLTVVHADDTFGTLESRSSWDEWREDYEYDDRRASSVARTNDYARAYASRPSEPTAPIRYETPIRRRSMRAQRRMVFTRLLLGAIVVTSIAFVSGYSILVDLAALTWLGVAGFIALALYSVSQGYLNDTSLPLHLIKRRSMATIEPLYAQYDEPYDEPYEEPYEDEFVSEYYESSMDERWRRQDQRRRALG